MRESGLGSEEEGSVFEILGSLSKLRDKKREEDDLF